MNPLNFALTVIILTFSLQSSGFTKKYPESWWLKVDPKDLKSWEISPDSAPEGHVILSKRTELGVFSNFAHTPFSYDGEIYESVEAFWQMMKYPEGKRDPRNNKNVSWPYKRNQVKKFYGLKAKYAGNAANKNMELLGIKWITYKGKKIEYKGKDANFHYQLIKQAISNKINQNPELFKLLLKTKGLILLPDHVQKKDSPPAYFYHQILMSIRDSE